jgi:hypothetical protein
MNTEGKEGATATKGEGVTSVVLTVDTKLLALGVEQAVIDKVKTDLGAETVEDLVGLTEDDLIQAGMKKLQARKVIAALAAEKKSVTEVTTTGSVGPAVSFDAVLPTVPTDTSWLESLRTGGVLKVDQSTVIAAIRAALAHKAGLYRIPDALAGMMETFADANEEQVDPEYFKLRKQMTRRSYAEVFAAIEGLDGSYVTEARKNQLFARIDDKLWPAIAAFYEQLKSWQDAWMKGAANPAMMMGAIMAMGNGGGMGMPPGLMQPPDTGTLRDTADAMADAVNKVFAGTGVQIASALAYDASKIKETLENPRLPALTGVANRDQMLRQLGVAVSATYPRMETNLTRFVLSVMRLKDQPAGNEELQYLSALFMLGSQIPWDQLGGTVSAGRRPTGVGGVRRDGASL